MKIFIPLLCLTSMVLAEAPLGDGYPTSRSSHHHDHDDHGYDHSQDFQRSLSQEYGPPTSRSFGNLRNSISTEYGAPNVRNASPRSGPSSTYLPSSRSGPSQEYGVPDQIASSRTLSTEYGVPNARSQPSTEYGLPNARSQPSNEYGVPSARSQPSTEYGVPNARSSPSQQYGPPATRSGLSQEYGVPEARHSLSQEYGAPASRSSPSQEYGAPVSSRSSLSQEYGPPSARTPSTQYGTPEFRSTPSEEYGAPSQRSFGSRTPSQKYGPPTSRNSPFSNSVSHEYDDPAARTSDAISITTPRTPAKSFASSARSFKPQSEGRFGARSGYSKGKTSARNFDSYAQEPKAISQSYGVPAARELSDTYGVPSSRGVSQEYGAPSSRISEKKTTAIASSYASARSSHSDTFGAPAARDSMPSEQYGVPDQYSSLNSQGYSYARDALNELLNQEPANYDFSYKVNDYESGSDFGHTESRQENRAEGSYFVVLPDGTKQVVEYEADERGFKPRISVEPADLGRSGGYDDNAADIARSADGPY